MVLPSKDARTVPAAARGAQRLPAAGAVAEDFRTDAGKGGDASVCAYASAGAKLSDDLDILPGNDIAVGMERSLDVLQPYFKLRKATGRTFYRSDKRQKPLDLSQLH